MIINCMKCGKLGDNGLGWRQSRWCAACREISTYESATLKCSECGKKCFETYIGNRCSDCAAAYHKSETHKATIAWQKKWHEKQKVKQEQVMSTENLVKKTGVDKAPMKKGEVRRLPKAQSALWTEQWAVMGSGKFPYIVSHKKNAAGADIEWQCSCPAWTTTTPREDCKHILKVKLVENIPLTTKSNGSVFQLTQLTSSGVSVKPTAAPTPKAGRKFR